jgi:hypothetical protein
MATTTWNPSDTGTGFTFSNGNLTLESTGGVAYFMARATTSQSSGKLYFELSITGGGAWAIGLANSSAALTTSTNIIPGGLTNTNSVGWDGQSNGVFIADTKLGSSPNQASGIQQLAVDLTNGRIWVNANGGNWNNSGSASPATGVGGFSLSTLTYGAGLFPALGMTDASGITMTANFGATAFSETMPAGFVSWNTGDAGETFALAATWPDFASVIAAADSKPVKSSLLTLHTPLLLLR